VKVLPSFSRVLFLLKAGIGGWGMFENPDEGGFLPFEAISKRLVKPQQTEETEVCALVNCKVCELVKVLSLLVVTNLEEFNKSNANLKPVYSPMQVTILTKFLHEL
jgi:hypothetical protein